MRIDYEYIEKILKVFLDSKTPIVNWDDFNFLHGKNEGEFVFHIEIMVDKELIQSTAESGSMGITRGVHDYFISVVEWRLSSEGHDFAIAITKPDVLTTIKEKFQQEGLSSIIELSKKIVLKQAEKLLE